MSDDVISLSFTVFVADSFWRGVESVGYVKSPKKEIKNEIKNKTRQRWRDGVGGRLAL